MLGASAVLLQYGCTLLNSHPGCLTLSAGVKLSTAKSPHTRWYISTTPCQHLNELAYPDRHPASPDIPAIEARKRKETERNGKAKHRTERNRREEIRKEKERK